MQPRIVVTGMGAVSPLGPDVPALYAGLRAGHCGIREIEPAHPTGYRVTRAGVVDEPGIPERGGRALGLAKRAGGEALRQAEANPATCALVLGSALGESLELEEMVDVGGGLCHQRSLADRVAEALGSRGIRHQVASNCAAGNHAIELGCLLLRRGEAEAVLALGVDTLPYVDLLGFSRLLLQAPDICRPFDLNRKGTTLAEGAGALFLETRDAAARRNVEPLAEVLGCGLSCDAGGAFDSRVDDVRTLEAAARQALREARLDASAIDYVSAHGTGTKLNDARETAFVRALLGSRADRVPMSSVKSMLGHGQGAAASLEAISCVLSLQHDLLFPTLHYETPDPRCDLDCVPNEARQARIDVALSNSFGIGGHNALVLLGRWGRT